MWSEGARHLQHIFPHISPPLPQPFPHLLVMDNSLRGKVAIISASDSGIGAQIARDLANFGANVVVNYPFAHFKSRADQVLAELQNSGIAVEADLSTTTGPQTLID